MDARPSVFKRGFAMLWTRPVAYASATLLPYVVVLGLPLLLGRIWFHLHPPRVDPLTLWRLMSVGEKLLVILAMIASSTVPAYLGARGVCRMALEQQRDGAVSLGAVLWDMLRFVPVAFLYFLSMGIATFLGSFFLIIPGVLIASACALIIPAGIDGHLGPLAAIKRGLSLVGRVYGRVLGVYAAYIAFVIAGRIVMTVFAAIGSSGDEGGAPVSFFLLLALWFVAILVAMAPVNIMCTLLYCEARQAEPPPLPAAEAAMGRGA